MTFVYTGRPRINYGSTDVKLAQVRLQAKRLWKITKFVGRHLSGYAKKTSISRHFYDFYELSTLGGLNDHQHGSRAITGYCYGVG